ncbi:unnamed protein product [Medioppia subpectinata]|uniref:Ubiquitin carboxyl-terminal hydrolase n=1 Tax=Medioppia subpectinata TaxID=1979941 RepID=A0A7R9KWD5_9ACAR|nr:unnamed protein product [Medioppia subpectinata]CAG2110965.1 unnamed protein product [Medioppia subpectinata]
MASMDTNDQEMDCQTDVSEVLQLIHKPMQKGELWYLLDKKWFELCKLYVNDRQQVHNPGPVDNSALFQSMPTTEPWTLRERLQEELDYQFVPEEGWHLLVKEFGVTSDEHVIRRAVIEQGTYSAYCMVEVYPIELKLCTYGSKDVDIIIKHLSRVTTLAQLEADMKKLFSVDDTKDTQLWSNGSVLNAHNELSEPSSSNDKTNDNQSLNDAGLISGTVVTLEVRNSDGTWPSSRPRYGVIATRSSKCVPGLCGLMNLGNTCFMNSALQCLSNTQPLTEFLLSDQYWQELNTDNPLGMRGEIAKSYAELIKALWSGSHTCLAPREFKLSVGRFAPQFSGFSQQDCQELMAFLLDGLHEDLNRVKQKPYIEVKTDVDLRPDSVMSAESWDNYKKRNDSIIVDTFHALLKSTLVCPDCNLVSVTFDPFCYLSLPLPVKRERQIDVTFVPTLTPNQQIDNNNETQEQLKAIQITRLNIPKYGTIADICNAVAKAVNDSSVLKHVVESERLVVTDVYNHRFHKIFGREESYSTQMDEIVVYEVQENCSSVAVYLREVKADETTALFGRPFIVSVSDSNYENLYESVTQQLRRFMKIPLSEEESDSDEGVAECERTDRFSLTFVNSYGSLDIERLDRTKPFELNNRNFLAVDLPTRVKTKYYNESEVENAYKLAVQKQAPNGPKTCLPLSECISQFTTTERLGADDPWYCPKCKKHQMASKKFDLWTLPKVLIIHLKRFSYSRVYRDKLDILVDFPLQSLDMGEYLLNNPNNESKIYDLIAVANHYGGLGGGHYTAYAKNCHTKKWHYFDDSNVSLAAEDNVVSKAAYVLFYQRRE